MLGRLAGHNPKLFCRDEPATLMIDADGGYNTLLNGQQIVCKRFCISISALYVENKQQQMSFQKHGGNKEGDNDMAAFNTINYIMEVE